MGTGISAASAELDREVGGRPAAIGGVATAVREAATSGVTLPTDVPQFVQNF
jgi:hypothetical protein